MAQERVEDAGPTGGADLANFFNLSIDLMCIADFEGRFTRVNPSFEQVLGHPVSEFIGVPFLNFVHPEDVERTSAETQLLRQGSRLVAFENRYRCRDGSYRTLLWDASADAENRLFYACARDVTAIRESEALSCGTEKFMTSLVENIPHMIFVKDARDLRFVRINKAGEELLGLPREQMVGKSDYDFFPPDEVEFFMSKDRAVLEGREMVDIAEEPIQTAGGLRLLHTKKIPILGEDGEPRYMLGISEDITESKQKEAELYRAKNAAEAANRSKSEFLANMSHELRTPLNAIIGFSEVLEDQTFGELNERQTRFVTNILGSGRHLLQLINDILDIAKIEAGKLSLNRQNFSVESALRDVTAIVNSLAVKKGVNYDLELGPGLPNLFADQPKFKQIMYNLVSNAIKFTRAGGTVRVLAELASMDGAAAVRVCVIDTGIGIKPEDQDRVFGQFEQVDSSYSRQQQGTGLGLSLTKNLVEMQGGRIWVTSEGQDGKGSVFAFLLPVRHEGPEDEPTPAPTDSSEAGDLEVPSAPWKGQRPQVLVVEDDTEAGDLMEDYLVEGGYRVARLESGEGVMEQAAGLQPQAITLDIMLPHKDGWQVLSELKANPNTSDIPVIIVSMTDDRQLGFSLGAVDFLTKPADKTRLLRAIERADALNPRPHPWTILVVDDELTTHDLMTHLLGGQGHRLLFAANGATGVRMAVDLEPNVIILDLLMPGMSGFEVVRQLRDNPATRAIPIIIFSGQDVSAEERELLHRDIRAIISKSAREELLSELEALWPQARQ